MKFNEFGVNRSRLLLAEAEENREAAREPARFLVKAAEEMVDRIRKPVAAEREPPVKLVDAEKELQEAKARLADAETDRPEALTLPQP